MCFQKQFQHREAWLQIEDFFVVCLAVVAQDKPCLIMFKLPMNNLAIKRKNAIREICFFRAEMLNILNTFIARNFYKCMYKCMYYVYLNNGDFEDGCCSFTLFTITKMFAFELYNHQSFVCNELNYLIIT